MAETDLPLTQPCQEEGRGDAGNGAPLQQHQWGTVKRGLQIQTKKINKQVSELETELGRMEQVEPNRLLLGVTKLHQSTLEMLLDVEACAEQQSSTHPRQHPQSWPRTNSARAPSAADQLHAMPPGTDVPDSGPKAIIHLEGEHYPRLQA
ncbi:uncharacterized protein LOC144860287 [Branchiostoma floridae x Branchiostoma japonicum]